MTMKKVIQKIKAKLNFHGVSDTDVLKVGNTACDGLLNNPAFPKHAGSPADLPAGSGQLQPVDCRRRRWR